MNTADTMEKAAWDPSWPIPPGMPTPTADDVAAAGQSHGGGLAKAPTPSDPGSWPWWIWAAGGTTIVVGIGLYMKHRSTQDKR